MNLWGKKGGWNDGWIITVMDHVTYQGEEFTEEELLRMNNLWRVKGYYGTREFYQPDELDVQKPLPDARNVLRSRISSPMRKEKPKWSSSVRYQYKLWVIEGTDGLGNLGIVSV